MPEAQPDLGDVVVPAQFRGALRPPPRRHRGAGRAGPFGHRLKRVWPRRRSPRRRRCRRLGRLLRLPRRRRSLPSRHSPPRQPDRVQRQWCRSIRAFTGHHLLTRGVHPISSSTALVRLAETRSPTVRAGGAGVDPPSRTRSRNTFQPSWWPAEHSTNVRVRGPAT
jgi:hypothetical protein